ncbi:MAG TPA: nicotinate phosphoribosyltransferase [Mogibacterium sp.]|nr:nicotinate phosphoribosyltransferase [Mogibacterium sp.]
MLNDYNLTMLTDFYEITMANGYFQSDNRDSEACFDLFYRRVPDKGGFAIMAGLEQIVNYLKNLKFTEEDIKFLRSKNMFCEDFFDYLRDFEFKCDVWSIPEGYPIFPYEPVITVKGPLIQAQYIETYILMQFNHQSLIATKANRIVRAAQGRSVMEFGTRRAQGADAAVYGARAAYIAGCAGTACTIADRNHFIPAMGTMAHSWVQSFDTEYEAFKKYTEIYPQNATLLVDTYNVLKSGIPNAIKVFKELKPANMGVRVDSGDITYLTRECRKMLNEAGLEECKIVVSNSLDEYIIRDVILEGAEIDSFGVGERLITAKSEPVFGGVYKLSGVGNNGEIFPKMKISENVEKITNPGFKKVVRFYSKETGKAMADLIMLRDEPIPDGRPFEIFDPDAVWKRKILENYEAKELQVQIFDRGKCVYKEPTIEEIRETCREQVDTLWGEVLRFENPQTYYVDLSKPLWNLKHELLNRYGSENL